MDKKFFLICIMLLTHILAGCSSEKDKPLIESIQSESSNEDIYQEKRDDTIFEQTYVNNDEGDNKGENYTEIKEDLIVDKKKLTEDKEDSYEQETEWINENSSNDLSNNSLNIIDKEQIEREGGEIEFAEIITYGEFVNLGWVGDIDVSLDKEKRVYIVKVYYREGFEHYKIGMIENCEAIGIYDAENGTYLGGSFRERDY